MPNRHPFPFYPETKWKKLHGKAQNATLVTAFQQTCVPEAWRDLTLSKLRHKLFWLPGELTRPQNRPTLRLAEIPENKTVMERLLHQVHRQKPLTE